MLVLTRIIFTVSDRITKSNEQTAWVVLGLSLLGFYLGRKGWWLPWSADVALYSLSFYFLGVLFKKHRILSLVKNNAVLYFILSIIWAYMIYSGGLELAIRSYPSYTITILGSISGIMIIYQFSSFLKNCSGLKAPAAVLSYIGSKTMIILFVHTLSGKLVNSMIPEQLSRNGAVYSVLFILAQVAIALLIDLIIGSIRKLYVTKKVD
ncbi:MAG: hypothetical protein IIZ41_10715 [Lachnospiraceae bacterium]|nr:hypothetical protein [Lachnospiraceae bacterium]